MQQTTDTDFPYFFGRESLLLGNDHGNGCYIHAVFEGVFVTGFERGDINCDGIIAFNGTHQVIGNALCGGNHFLGGCIVVDKLDTGRDTFTDTDRKSNFCAVFGTEPFDIFFCFRRSRNLFWIFLFFPLLNVNRHNTQFQQGINHIIIQLGTSGNEITSQTVNDRMIELHARF